MHIFTERFDSSKWIWNIEKLRFETLYALLKTEMYRLIKKWINTRYEELLTKFIIQMSALTTDENNCNEILYFTNNSFDTFVGLSSSLQAPSLFRLKHRAFWQSITSVAIASSAGFTVSPKSWNPLSATLLSILDSTIKLCQNINKYLYINLLSLCYKLQEKPFR